MEQLFREISSFASVRGLFLLSEYGDVLFESGWQAAGDGYERIKATLRSVGGSQCARFSFENGSFCLYRTAIGYLLIGMECPIFDGRVIEGCAAVGRRLVDPEARKEVLLHALNDARQELLPQIVKALVPYGDTEVSRGLVRLLAKEKTFGADVRDRILLFICKALGYCPSWEGLRSLQNLLASAGSLRMDVRAAAEMSLEQIRAGLPEQEQERRGPETEEPPAPAETIAGRTAAAAPSITDLPEERRIRGLLEKGEKENARRLLRELIVAMAAKKRFDDAENLREWLIEVDPTALGDIIKTAEIIEKEKQLSVDKDYLTVWSALSEALDANEFSTLYHSLEQRKVAAGTLIVKQGARQSALFFINSGRVELFFREKGRDVTITTVGPGEILGAGTFFEASVWTFYARSLGAEIALLRLEKLQQWQKSYPSLESNLNDFCLRFTLPHESFRRMGRDRRVFERVRISGRISMSVLDKDGKESGVGAKGDLFDISMGGVAFFLRISQKKNARLLFGKKVSVTMAAEATPVFTISGVVLAVRSQPVVGNEYSVHVQFSRVLDQNELKSIVNVGKEQP